MNINNNKKKLSLALVLFSVISIGVFSPIIVSCSKKVYSTDTNKENSVQFTQDLNLISFLDDDSGDQDAFNSNLISIKDGYEVNLKVGRDSDTEKYKFLTYNQDKNPVSIQNNKISYSYELEIKDFNIDLEKLNNKDYQKNLSVKYFSNTNLEASSEQDILTSIEESIIKNKIINEKNMFLDSDRYLVLSEVSEDRKSGYKIFLNKNGKFVIETYITNSENKEDGVFIGIKSISLQMKQSAEANDYVINNVKSLNEYYLQNHKQDKYEEVSDISSDIFNSSFSSFEEWKQRIDSFINLPTIDLQDPGINSVLEGVNLVSESDLWISRDNLMVGNPDDKDIGKAVANFVSNIKSNTQNLVKDAILNLSKKDRTKLGNSYFGKKELYLYENNDTSKKITEVEPISKTLMIGGNKGIDTSGNDISSIKGDYSYDFVIPFEKTVEENSRYLFSATGISATIMHQIEGRKYDGGGTTNISYPSLKFNFLDLDNQLISSQIIEDEKFRKDYTNESFNVLSYSGSNVEIEVPKGTKQVTATIEIKINLEKSGEAPRWDDYLNTFLKLITNVVTNITSYGSSGAFKFLFDGSLAGGAPNIFASLFNSIEAMINNPFAFGIALAGYEDNSIQDLIKLTCPAVKPYVSTIFDIGYDGKPKWDPDRVAIDNYQWQSIQNKAISNVLGLLGSSIFNAIFGSDLTELNFNKRADINSVIITSTNPKAFLVNLDANKQIEKKLDFSSEIQKENFKKVSNYVNSANNKLIDQKDKYNEYINKMQTYYESTINNLFEIISNKDMSFVERNINNPALRLSKELESNIIQVGRSSKDYNYMAYLKKVADSYVDISSKDANSNNIAPDIINDTYMNKIQDTGIKLEYFATYNYSGSLDKIEIEIKEEIEIQNIYKEIYDLKNKLEANNLQNNLTDEQTKEIISQIYSLEKEVDSLVKNFNDTYQKYSNYLTKEIYWVSLLKQLTKNQAEWLLNNAFYSLTSQSKRIPVAMNYRYIDNEVNFKLVNGIDISYQTLIKSNLSKEDIDSIMNLDIKFLKILLKNNDFISLKEVDMSDLNIKGNFNSSRNDILDQSSLMGESSNIWYIDLSGNKISDFDFKGYKNLRAIDLSNNQLSGDISNILENAYTNVDSTNGIFSLNLYKNYLLFPENSSKTANEILQEIHNTIYGQETDIKWKLSKDSLTWQISVLNEISSYSFSIDGTVVEKTGLSDSYITYLEPLGFNSEAQNITARIKYEIVNDELHVKDIIIPEFTIDSSLNEVELNKDIKQFFINEIKEAISTKKLVSVSGIYQFMQVSKVSKSVLKTLGIDSIDTGSLNFESKIINYSVDDNIGSFKFESSRNNIIEITELKIVQGDPYYILKDNNLVSNEIEKLNTKYSLNMSYLEFNKDKNQSIWKNNYFIYVLNKNLFNLLDEKAKSLDKEITIPSGISIIEQDFLSNSNLKSLTLNHDLIKVEENSFSNNQIQELIIPNSLKYIGNYAFYSNKIDTLVLGSNLTYVGRYSFRYNNLTNINFNDSLNIIDNYAFANNKIKDELTLPLCIEYVGAFSFANNSISTVNIIKNEKLWESTIDSLWEKNINLYNLIFKFDDITIVSSFINQTDEENKAIKPTINLK